MEKNKIVLLSKLSGYTSFSSLYSVKHAFNTQKVGHTGTLDSFAQGLLVVCTGSLTKIAGKITEFNKVYEAVLKFGEQTDTLECTGKIIKKTELPLLSDLKNALEKFKGELFQVPPLYSAIHVDGKRASDVARSGKIVELAKRKITVFDSELLETSLTPSNRVSEARIKFSVSKGTYIRSLARDIAEFCNSSATLYGLYRKSVGNFNAEDSAGFSLLKEFSIKSALENARKLQDFQNKTILREKKLLNDGLPKKAWKYDEELLNIKKSFFHYDEKLFEQEIIKKSLDFTPELSSLCGFGNLILQKESEKSFKNGMKLHSSMFTSSPFSIEQEIASVFDFENRFLGLLQKDENGYFKYSFVIN